MDNKLNETLEFVRSQLPYTEIELKEKPILQFLDIVERAKKKSAESVKTGKKKGALQL